MSSKLLRMQRDFSGGLSEVANDNMKDNELTAAKNVIPAERYGLARAEGTVIAYPQISGGGTVKELIELPLASGETLVLAFTEAADGQDLHRYDETNETWTCVLASTAAVLDWFIYAYKLYWLDGSDFKVYDGTTVSSVTEEGSSGLWGKIKTAVAVEQRGQRWFYATTDNEVIFTELGWVNKTSSINLINISSGNADRITALHEFNEGLLVFQTRAVFFLSGWDLAGGTDVQLSRINVTTGTKWPKTVATVENAVLYLGSNGVYQLRIPVYSTQIAATNLGEGKISDRLRRLDLQACCAKVWSGTYYLSLTTPEETLEYRYYTSIRGFYGEYTQGAACYAPGFLGRDYLYIGCANGYVLKYDEASYSYVSLETGGKTAIPIVIHTKAFDVVGAMVQDAKLKRAFLVQKQYAEQSTNLTVQIKADYLDKAWEWELDWDESLVFSEGDYGRVYWGWEDSVTKEININRKAKRMQFLLRDDEHLDQPLLIYGVGMLYKRKKVKGSREGVTKTTVIQE